MSSESSGAANKPVALFLVSSGPRGDRLLFRYPIQESIPSSHAPLVVAPENRFKRRINQQVEDYCLPLKSSWSGFEKFIKDGQLSGFTDDILAHLLAVKNDCCGRKFMIKINDAVFAGFPAQYEEWGREDAGKQTKVYLHVAFVLMDTAGDDVIGCYQELSRRLCYSLIREDKRCSYLSHQKHIMWAIQDELFMLPSPEIVVHTGDGEFVGQRTRAVFNPSQRVLERSCLGVLLQRVFEDLKQKGSTSVHINNWVHLSFCVAPRRTLSEGTGCLDSLRPHLSLLLLEERRTILEAMKPNPSPLFSQLLKVASPRKNFLQMAFSADLPLNQLYLLVSQLIYWGKAAVIYPIKLSNIYVLNPAGPSIGTTTTLHKKFAQSFPNDTLTLFHIAAMFSRPHKLTNHVTALSAACSVPSNGLKNQKSVQRSLSAQPGEPEPGVRLRKRSGRWDGKQVVIYNSVTNTKTVARSDVIVVRRRDNTEVHDNADLRNSSNLEDSYQSNQDENDFSGSYKQEVKMDQYSHTPKSHYDMGSRLSMQVGTERVAFGTSPGNQIVDRMLQRRVTSAVTPTRRQPRHDSVTYHQGHRVSQVYGGEISRSNPALNQPVGSQTPYTPLIPRDYFLTPQAPPSDLISEQNWNAPTWQTANYAADQQRIVIGRDDLKQQMQLLQKEAGPGKQLLGHSVSCDVEEQLCSEKTKLKNSLKCCVEIISWLLRHSLIGQQHTFVRLFISNDSSGIGSRKSSLIGKTMSDRFRKYISHHSVGKGNNDGADSGKIVNTEKEKKPAGTAVLNSSDNSETTESSSSNETEKISDIVNKKNTSHAGNRTSSTTTTSSSDVASPTASSDERNNNHAETSTKLGAGHEGRPSHAPEGRPGAPLGSQASEGKLGEPRSVMVYREVTSVLTQAGLSRDEVEGVCKCAAAKDLQSVVLFARLVRYFDGTVPIDVMSFNEGIPMAQVVSTIDKFRDVLFTFQHVVCASV